LLQRKPCKEESKRWTLELRRRRHEMRVVRQFWPLEGFGAGQVRKPVEFLDAFISLNWKTEAPDGMASPESAFKTALKVLNCGAINCLMIRRFGTGWM
jgi:hypothetical protein